MGIFVTILAAAFMIIPVLILLLRRFQIYSGGLWESLGWISLGGYIGLACLILIHDVEVGNYTLTVWAATVTFSGYQHTDISFYAIMRLFG